MKNHDPGLVKDVEELLEETVLEEATQAVWEAFQTAIDGLDPDSKCLLQLHFEGKSDKDLSQKLDLPEKDVKAWLLKSKREVIAKLGRQTKIRQ